MGSTNVNAVVVSVIYVGVAVGITVWLAKTLFHNGAAFLHDVFVGKPELAEAVNRLLVTGFYMLSLGYSLFILRASRGYDGFAAVQFLVNRLALMLVSLAAIHFVNVFVFWRIRARREQRHMPTPVAAQMFMPQSPPAPRTS
jgi:hypothetical protein